MSVRKSPKYLDRADHIFNRKVAYGTGVHSVLVPVHATGRWHVPVEFSEDGVTLHDGVLAMAVHHNGTQLLLSGAGTYNAELGSFKAHTGHSRLLLLSRCHGRGHKLPYRDDHPIQCHDFLFHACSIVLGFQLDFEWHNCLDPKGELWSMQARTPNVFHPETLVRVAKSLDASEQAALVRGMDNQDFFAADMADYADADHLDKYDLDVLEEIHELVEEVGDTDMCDELVDELGSMDGTHRSTSARTEFHVH